MRYDTPIYFRKITPGEYDAETGNYEVDTIEETLRYASVMDTGTQTMTLVYGKIQQGSLTIHLQNRYQDPYDHIRIRDKLYQVDSVRNLRVKQCLIVSEVQT
nr:MAG TPA: head closure knob [Caudoviricetes sp.]